MRLALIGIYILCAIHTFAVLTDYDSQVQHRTKRRKLAQNTIDKQQKQVKQIIGSKKYFQSYHFQLDSLQLSIEFYLDSQVNDQVKTYTKVLWKHKNAYVLPSDLKSQRVEVSIYENENEIETERFYTKGGVKIDIVEDRLYKVVISHKRQAKSIDSQLGQNKLRNKAQKKHKISRRTKNHPRKYEQDSRRNNNNPRKYQQDDDSSSQESSSQEQNSQAFSLLQLSARVELLLNETKLLINQAQTKHLAEYTVEKYIEDSIEVYWVYEIVECVIIVICVLVQLVLIHKLFQQHSISMLI